MIAVARGTIINRVSEMMGRRRMNIKELEIAAGISYQTAWDIYHDRTKRIDFATIAGLCDALQADVGDLFQYAPSKDDGDS